MILRYLSDIHLEFVKPHKLGRLLHKLGSGDRDEVCVLAGDIGNPFQENYTSFMDHMNSNFKHTFVIPGNHEYYQKDKPMSDVNHQIQSLCDKYPNVTYLNNTVKEYGGYQFVGSTMWSKITDPSHVINDVYSIPNMDYVKYNRLNRMCVDFLEDAVQSTTNKCVVITHHIPSYRLIDDKYLTQKMQPYNQWFYNDMDDFIMTHRDRISCWIYGHTHTPRTEEICGIPFVCNPIGYPGENHGVEFDRRIVLKEVV